MRYTIFISAIVLFFCSCVDNSKKNLTIFKVADEGLIRSSMWISSSTESTYSALENRLSDYYHNQKAKIWQPKALQLKSYCEDFYQYINDLKEQVRKVAGLRISGGKEFYDEENITEVNKLFENKGEKLFQKLLDFRKNVLAVDTEINISFNKSLVLFAYKFDYTKQDSKDFTKIYFNNIPALAAMLMLTKLENNIRIDENKLAMFCLNKASPVIIHDDFPTPLITQSSKYVKAGEEIEITAGIGSYFIAKDRKFIIDGKVIKVDLEPVATYKLKTSLKPGKYLVPVVIEFKKPDGSTTAMTKSIEYTVINPNPNPQ
jgi:GldM N-terminal domain